MNILRPIDAFLNKTPMYKTVIYGLLIISTFTFLLSYFNFIPYNLLSLFTSLNASLFICVFLNFIISKILKLPTQYESSIITALILFLIIAPADSAESLIAISIASVVATISKYIFVYRNTHFFNPAAVGILSIYFLGYGYWWVASLYTLPIVLLTGLLIVRKVRREALFFSGIFAGLVGAILIWFFSSTSDRTPMDLLISLNSIFISGPIIFFLAYMVTEPHTIASNKMQQVYYALQVILLPIILSIIGLIQITPEISLLLANIVSFYISTRERFILKLNSITKLSDDILEYNFSDLSNPSRIFKFSAGQYLEWSLYHANSDMRGIRRYFTISSRPNTNTISFATKFPPKDESTFKNHLKTFKKGDTIYATQLGGDFTLPSKLMTLNETNLVMIAGGIGITPFISQIRDLLARNEHRSIVLFYCVRNIMDMVYREVLLEAVQHLNIKIVCIISDSSEHLPVQTYNNFFYEYGYITKEIIQKYTQILHNQYYISGPDIMVRTIKDSLLDNGVKNSKIHTDYFPGF